MAYGVDGKHCGKHWTDLDPDDSHRFREAGEEAGHCEGCGIHRDWPGARAPCTLPIRPPVAAKERKK